MSIVQSVVERYLICSTFTYLTSDMEHSEDLPNKLSEGKKQKTQGLTAAYSDAKKAETALGKEALECMKKSC